jgi:hypothetical protein
MKHDGHKYSLHEHSGDQGQHVTVKDMYLSVRAGLEMGVH